LRFVELDAVHRYTKLTHKSNKTMIITTALNVLQESTVINECIILWHAT